MSGRRTSRVRQNTLRHRKKRLVVVPLSNEQAVAAIISCSNVHFTAADGKASIILIWTYAVFPMSAQYADIGQYGKSFF